MTPAVVPTPQPASPFQPRGGAGPAVGPPQPGPTPFRWTIDEYHQLDQIEVFRDKKTFLLNGEIYVVAMPNPPHDFALGAVEDWLRIVFQAGHHVRTQKAFHVGTEHDPGPDAVVVPGSKSDYKTHAPTVAALVVEVADSSLRIDTTEKAEVYAAAGVTDYWVIDLVHGQLLVFRDPASPADGLGANAYRTHLVFGPGDTVSPLAAPNASVKVADLLP